MVIRQVFQCDYVNRQPNWNIPGIGDIIRGSLAILEHRNDFELYFCEHPFLRLAASKN